MKLIKRYVPEIYFHGKKEPLQLKDFSSEVEALTALEEKAIDLTYLKSGIPDLSDFTGGISHCEVREIYKIEL